MPNHVMNEVTFTGLSVTQKDAIVAAVRGEQEIDFATLLPLPLNLWWGSVSSLHEKAFPGTALDWCSSNWSTKWNAYGLNQGGRYQSVEESPDGLILRFQTAWSPPRGWLVALFNKFKVSFTYNWLDEGRERAVSGHFDYAALMHDRAAQPWAEIAADDETQLRMFRLLWGRDSLEDDAA